MKKTKILELIIAFIRCCWFLVEKRCQSQEIIPAEAKASELKKPVITRSLRSFIEKYNPKEAWIINLSLNFETAYKDTKIKFMPAVYLIGS